MVDWVFNVIDPLTLKLAPLLGAFLVAAALGVLAKANRAEAMLRELSASASISHVTGAATFFIGGGILSFHFDFTSLPAAVVSFLAFWWVLEGIVLLALSDRLPLRDPKIATLFRNAQFVALGGGAYLLVVGLIGRANLV